MGHSIRRNALAIGLVATAAIACGARGPLDFAVVDVYPDGGAPGVDASLTDGGHLPDGAPKDSGRDGADANTPPNGGIGGLLDSGIVQCGTCLFSKCGTQLTSCLGNTACSSALQCVATTCLAGGTPNPACVLTCGGSDPTAVLGLFTCVLGSCGGSCLSALGGLGGLGGGGTGGGGTGGGGGFPPPTPTPAPGG